MSLIMDFPISAFEDNLITPVYPTWEVFSERNDTSIVSEGHFALQWGVEADDWDIYPKDEGFFYLPIDRLVFYWYKCSTSLFS